jgi:hypothetical protein
MRDIWREFGEFHFERHDLHLHIEAGQMLVIDLRERTPDRFDGTKPIFDWNPLQTIGYGASVEDLLRGDLDREDDEDDR